MVKRKKEVSSDWNKGLMDFLLHTRSQSEISSILIHYLEHFGTEDLSRWTDGSKGSRTGICLVLVGVVVFVVVVVSIVVVVVVVIVVVLVVVVFVVIASLSSTSSSSSSSLWLLSSSSSSSSSLFSSSATSPIVPPFRRLRKWDFAPVVVTGI